MPVHNWWIEANIDGRETNLSGGPRSKDGGFDLTIYQRDEGSITTAIHLRGRTNYDGNLLFLEGTVYRDDEKLEFLKETKR